MAGFLDGLLNPDPNKVPSPKSLEARRRIADALMMRGADTSPVGHWSQGAARVADALIGGAEGMVYDRQERAATRGARESFDKIFGGAAPAPATDSGGWGAPKPAPTVTPGPTPAPAAPSAPGTYEARVQAVESPNGATNPQSGAAGFYQFMPKTAHGLAQQTQWGRGLSQDQVLAAIQADRAKQDELMKLYTAQSDSTLTGAGLPANDANRYALHWFGPGGGPSLLRADPAMPTADWVRSVRWDGASPDAVISQNRLDRFKTVGELRAHIEKSMGGAPQAAAAAPPAAPQMAPGTPTPFNPQGLDIRAATAALANPWLPEGQRAVLGAMIGQAMKPNEYGFTQADGVIYRTDPRTGAITVAGGAPKPPPVTTVDLGTEIGVMDRGGNVIKRIPKEQAADWTTVQGADGQTYMVNKRNPNERVTVGGAKPPDVKDIDGLRKEIVKLPQVDALITVAPIFNSMQAAAKMNSRAADLDLIYGLGKILDPGSVVREGEMVLVQKTGGIFDQMQGWVSALQGGAALPPDVRAGILATANSRVAELRRSADAAIEPYKGIIQRRGWSEADVMPGLPQIQPLDPATISTAPRPTAGPTPGTATAPMPQQSGSLPVMQTPDEARAKLKPGDQFKTPDGRTLRVPGGR